MPTSDRKRFYADLLERALWTFAQAFAAVLLADQALDKLDATLRAKLAAAAIAGGLAVLKAFVLGQLVGNKGTASTLPEDLDPATPPGTDPDTPGSKADDHGRGTLGLIGVILAAVGAIALVLILLGVLAASTSLAVVVLIIGVVLLLVDGSTRV